MIKVTKADGTELAYTDNPVYIKLSENGCYVPCSEKEATGIAVDSIAYHIQGRPVLKEECEDVMVTEVDPGKVSHSHSLLISELTDAILSLGGNV